MAALAVPCGVVSYVCFVVVFHTCALWCGFKRVLCGCGFRRMLCGVVSDVCFVVVVSDVCFVVWFQTCALWCGFRRMSTRAGFQSRST